MIKVLYDHEFFSAFSYSGITRYFHEVIRRVAVAEGYRASLFMGFHLNRYGIEAERGKLAHFFGRPRPNIPRTGRIFTALNDALFPWFGRLSNSDLLHQTYYAPCYPSFRGKRIITVYDMTYELMPQMFGPTNPFQIQKIKAIERADGIIAISESTKSDLMRITKAPAEKIKTIHLGNSLTLDPGPEPEFKRPYFLFVGQRVAHKNFPALLQAYARSGILKREHDLVCFGGSPFTPEESSEIAALGLAGRVHQMSGPDARMANLYRYATALAYPSFYEGFGLPVLEAMGYGCPVAASDVSSLPEVCGHAALYFDPRRGEEIQSVLERIVEDAALRADLGAKGLLRAGSFSWDRCAREHMEFYREVLNR